MSACAELAAVTGVAEACRILAMPRSSLYRLRNPVANSLEAARKDAKPPRSLDDTGKEAVRSALNSERFQDQSPREVYATLLDEGVYLCHWRTMYRILDEHKEVRERRNQLRHPTYSKPELLATGPNQLRTQRVPLGYHQTAWTCEALLLLSLCDARRLQPLRRRLDGGRTRISGITPLRRIARSPEAASPTRGARSQEAPEAC